MPAASFERPLTLESGQLLTLAQQALAAGKPFCFMATGISMWPTLREGDILEVEPCARAALRRGDLLLLINENGAPRVHRLIHFQHRPEGRYLITRGDALAWEDPAASERQVLGRVIALERRGRRILLTAPGQRLSGLLWVYLRPVLRLLIHFGVFLKHVVAERRVNLF